MEQSKNIWDGEKQDAAKVKFICRSLYGNSEVQCVCVSAFFSGHNVSLRYSGLKSS